MATLHDRAVRTFASDNYAGAHPAVVQAIVEANGGHLAAYGRDIYTQRLQEIIGRHFGEGAVALPVFNGTGANVLALQAILPPWGAAICANTAHIYTDENGAPERVAGIKLLPVPTPDGKVTPSLIDTEAFGWGDEHRAQPLAVSLTQSTEVGTVYTAEEIKAVVEHAHSLGMKVHIDGARLANAAASLGQPLAAFTRDVGVDVVSFGGTKNGLVLGEAIVVLDPGVEDAYGLGYLRKMNMQLGSKMRFISAQLIALLDEDLWLQSATHANAMAQRLATAVAGLEGVQITRPVQANAVFARLPAGVADKLRTSFAFYDWGSEPGAEVRWMCAWDTAAEDVDRFVATLSRLLSEL